MKKYCIAQHIMAIVGDALEQSVQRIDGFGPFATDSLLQPVLTVSSLTGEMEVPAMEQQQYTFINDNVKSIFGIYSQGYLFQMWVNGEDPMQLWMEKGSQMAYIKGHLEDGAVTDRLVRFTLWIAFGLATVHLNTLPIHTSTIVCQNKAVLFLGESGTGKSTHTRLWREHIDGSFLLNDDSPILRILEGEPWIFGSPWSGKTPCYRNEQYPLAGAVRLSQAPYNRIQKLNVLQAFAAIHPSCPPDFAYDDYLYDGISNTLDLMLQQVPFYHLACLPDADAARLSHSTLFPA